MKLRILALMLCAAMILSMAACAGEEASSAAPSPSESPAAFGDASLADVPIQEAETTSLPAEAPDNTSVFPEESLTEPETVVQDFTELAVKSVLVCDAVDLLPYNPDGDDMYFWRSIGYLIGEIGPLEGLIGLEDPLGKIQRQDAAIFAHAISATFSGEYPVVTQEDPFIIPGEDDTYLINMLPQEDIEIRMTENRFTAEGNTFTEEAEILRNGESLGTYTVTLTEYTGTDPRGQAIFGYSLVDLEAHNFQ